MNNKPKQPTNAEIQTAHDHTEKQVSSIDNPAHHDVFEQIKNYRNNFAREPLFVYVGGEDYWQIKLESAHMGGALTAFNEKKETLHGLDIIRVFKNRFLSVGE